MKPRMRVVRPHTAVPEPKSRSFGQTLILIILTMVVPLTVLSAIDPDNNRSFFHDWFAPRLVVSPESAASGSNLLASVAHKRTTEEMKAFWDRELNDLVIERWAKGRLPYPEINARFKTLHDEIIRQTGKPLSVGLVKNYYWAGNEVCGTSEYNITNDTYYVSLIMPNAMDMFEVLSRTHVPRWRERFESHIIITLMHELEHTTTAKRTRTNSAIDVMEESRAWAETCRHTIAPLRQVHNLPMNDYYLTFLVAWTQSMGDTNNPYWVVQMNKSYSGFAGKGPPN